MTTTTNYRSELRRYIEGDPNIIGVSETLEDELVGGRPSGRQAIRVTVKRKLAASQLSPKRRLPDEIDGVPVDVVVPNRRRQRDLRDELKAFAERLEKTCKTCRSAADLVEHIARLEAFVARHAPDLPPEVETRVKSGIESAQKATAGVAERCDSLLKGVKGAIRVLPGGISIGAAVMIAVIATVTVVGGPILANRLLAPAVTISNAGCDNLAVPGWVAAFELTPGTTTLASGHSLTLHVPWLTLGVNRSTKVVTVNGPANIPHYQLPAISSGMRVLVDNRDILGLSNIALKDVRQITLACK